LTSMDSATTERGAAGAGEPGDRRQQMKKKDGHIARRTILPRSRHGQRMLTPLGIRHAQADVARRKARIGHCASA
jgi:hypothetical protein